MITVGFHCYTSLSPPSPPLCPPQLLVVSSSTSPHFLSILRDVASSSDLFPHSSLFQKKYPIYERSKEMFSPKCAASDAAQLRCSKEDIKVLLRTKFCHPILDGKLDTLE